MSKNNSQKSEGVSQVSTKETEILLSLLEQILAADIPGDVVELGCYKGDTSVVFQRALQNSVKLQNSIKTSQNPANTSYNSTKTSQNPVNSPYNSTKNLWLYDSFAGLPEKTKEDSSAAGDQFKTGELFVTKREVIEKFKRQNLSLPKIKKAFFEDLDQNEDLPVKISFAFLDGDLYTSIKTSLSLIESKMQPGSIIVVHDYNNPELPGSARATDEWIKSHSAKIANFKTQETLAIIKVR